MQQLKGLDGVLFLGEIPNAPLHIGAIYIYDPSSAPGGVLPFSVVENRLLELANVHVPALRCRVDQVPWDLDEPYWVEDEHFNLALHVKRMALPKPANWKTFHEVCARLHAEPLDRSRPLWEAWFIEGLDALEGIPAGSVAVLFKVHHAMVDGKTGVRLFSALHSTSPEVEDRPVPPPIDLSDFRQPGLTDKLLRAARHNAAKPIRLGKIVGKLVPRMLAISKDESTAVALDGAHAQVPYTLFNNEIGSGRVFGHLGIDLDEARAMAHGADATLNDIAVAVVGGALREYLQSRHGLPGYSLTAGIPVDVRAKDDTSPGNAVSFTHLPLFTHLSDPWQRLVAIRDCSRCRKEGHQRLGRSGFKGLVDNLYPGLIVPLAKRFYETGWLFHMSPVVNTVISNVPGVSQACYIQGAKLVDFLGIGLIAPTVGLFHAVCSTEARFNIAFISCPEMMPEPEHYEQALQHSWLALKAAVPPAPAKPVSKPVRRRKAAPKAR